MASIKYTSIPTEFRKTFVNDFKIPISLFDNTNFAYFCELYEKEHSILEKVGWFLEVLDECKSEQKHYFVYRQELLNQIVDDIKNSNTYKTALSNFDSMVKQEINLPRYKHNNCYTPENHDRSFISVDIKHACYTVFKIYNPNAVEFFKDSFEEFLKQYTRFNAFLKSKFIRVFIFGQLDAKKIASMTHYFMYSTWLKMQSSINDLKLCMINNDEVIVYGENVSVQNLYKSLQYDANVSKFYKINSYKLYHLGYDMYAKKFDTIQLKYELKCVPHYYHAQVFKQLKKLPATEQDKKFSVYKQTCTFDDFITIDIPSGF